MGNKSAYQSLMSSSDCQTLTSATLIILFWCWNGQKWSCGDVPVVLSLTRSFHEYWTAEKQDFFSQISEVPLVCLKGDGCGVCVCVCLQSFTWAFLPPLSAPFHFSGHISVLASSHHLLMRASWSKKKKKQAGEAEMRCNRIAEI